jgi:hypothetical protein
MNIRACGTVLAAVLAGWCAGCQATMEQHESTAVGGLGRGQAAPECFVLAYFTGEGRDGLRLAESTDLLTWKALNHGRPVLAPTVGLERLLRDPSLARGPDGTFHLVWTVGWNEPAIGYASSRDLVHWTEPRLIPVMTHEPTARNAWAPEVFFDDVKGEFLITWATTIPGRFPKTAGSGEDGYDHRLYGLTTKDFQSFTPSRLLYDPGFNVIDGFIARSGTGYVLAAKNETAKPEPCKRIFLAQAREAAGPYGRPSPYVTAAWVEGPCLVRSHGRWLLFYDRYTRGSYGAAVSTDLAHWTDISGQLTMPPGARHGTVVRVPAEVAEALRDGQ